MSPKSKFLSIDGWKATTCIDCQRKKARECQTPSNQTRAYSDNGEYVNLANSDHPQNKKYKNLIRDDNVNKFYGFSILHFRQTKTDLQ